MRRPRLVFALVLLAAAVLRLAGLNWGLAHRPTHDERVFVESAWKMRVSGDWDQRFYEYPGLALDLFALAFLALPAAGEAPPLATAVARGITAGFGVLSVALVYVLGNRLLGRRAGLFAAALLAVSPVEVETAHMVRPDVILESFVLLTFLALSAAGRAPGADAGAGLALGGVLATKLTGWLLVPVYVVGRLLAPGSSLRRFLWTGLIALGVLLVTTPALVVRTGALLDGMRDQWAFHYAQAPTFLSWLRLLAFYGGAALRALGPVGLMLALAGIVLAWGDLRSWLPVVLFPAALVVVLATAVLGHDRLLVPAIGLMALLAAGAYDATAERRPGLGLVLAVATLAVPLAFSVLADVRYLLSTPYDRARQWLYSRPQARVLFIYYRVALDSPRFERHDPAHTPEQRRLLARHFDLVAAPPGEPAVAGFRVERAAEPDTGWPGPRWPLLAFFAPGPLAPRYAPVDLTAATLTSSAGPEALGAVIDGEPDTAWSTEGDGWLQVELPPTAIGRITIEGLPDPRSRSDRAEGGTPEFTSGVPERCAVRPAVSADLPPVWREPTWVARGPALLLEARPVRALRLTPSPGCARLRVAELRLEAAAAAP